MTFKTLTNVARRPLSTFSGSSASFSTEESKNQWNENDGHNHGRFNAPIPKSDDFGDFFGLGDVTVLVDDSTSSDSSTATVHAVSSSAVSSSAWSLFSATHQNKLYSCKLRRGVYVRARQRCCRTRYRTAGSGSQPGGLADGALRARADHDLGWCVHLISTGVGNILWRSRPRPLNGTENRKHTRKRIAEKHRGRRDGRNPSRPM